MNSDDSALCQRFDGAELATGNDVSAALSRAVELQGKAKAPATVAAYTSDLADFQAWAEPLGLGAFPVPPAVLAAYIGHLDTIGRSLATIQRRCSALAGWHRHHGAWSPTESPDVRDVLAGLQREHAGRKSPKKAFTADMVRNFVLHGSTSPRDRALIAVGFVTGLRRSELLALEWSDVDDCPDTSGLLLRIRRSKTDQNGRGAYVAVPRTFSDVDPAALLLALRGPGAEGRIFEITARTVLRIAKRVATLAGLDSAPYGAHSLRSGMCSTAARAGVSLAESMLASRHKSADVAAGYVQSVAAGTNRAHRAAADALGKR